MAIAAAHAKAVALYFLLRNRLGTETVSWVCVLGAAPFAAMGFFRYHGMTFEKFLGVFIRSVLFEPRVYLFKPRSHYAEITKEYRTEQMRRLRKQKSQVRLRKVKNSLIPETNADRIPRSIQDLIPVAKVYSDGGFLCGRIYTKSGI